MPEIPADIWIHVAKFMTYRDLYSTLSLNRTFFHRAMDMKYSSIWLDNFSDLDAILRRLQRLREPDVARRVVELYLQLDTQHEDERKEDSWGYSVSELVEVMQSMTETVSRFTSVTSFSFKWTPLPSEEPLSLFCTETWKTLGSNLETLTLYAIPPGTLPRLLSTTEVVKSLRTMRVDFAVLWPGSPMVPNSDIIAAGDALAQFANKVASTLRDLYIFSPSYENVPLAFFRHQRNIPNLERLSVRCQDDLPTHRIVDLICFISSHAATLRHILWGVRTDKLMDYLSMEEFDQAFANLLTLDLFVPQFLGRFAPMSQCISRSASTLTSLVLQGHDMTYNEVEMLACILAPGSIQELNFRVKHMSPDLMLLLARKLPCLEQLTIEYMELRVHDAVSAKEGETEWVIAGKFAVGIRELDFRDWHLRDIGIIRGKSSREEGIENILMELVAERVPSVHKFRGLEKQVWRRSKHKRLPYSNPNFRLWSDNI